MSVVSWDDEFIYVNDFYASTEPEQLSDADGNVLLEYYHYNKDVSQLSFNPDNMTVTIYTASELYHSELMLRIILSMIVTLEMLIIFITHSVIIKRKKKADKKDVYHTAKVQTSGI